MSIAKENTVNLGPHPQYPKSVKAGIPKLLISKSGWKKLPIGELFDVVSRPVDVQDETDYNLITVKRSRGGVTERETLPGKKIAVKSQFYVEGGDFLISKRQIVHGACGFVPAELSGYIVSNEYSVLRCREIILPEFLSYLMHTPYFQQTCFHSSIGIHVEKLIFKLDEWFKWPIYLPSKSEQKKIATFFYSVDDKFKKLLNKHEQLETYKRGIMQKLFSQEIRFKKNNGADFPAWEEKTLGTLGIFKSGVGFPDKEQGGSEGIPFYKVSDMNLQGNEREMIFFNNAVSIAQIKKLKLKPIDSESYIFAKVGAAIFLERKRKAKQFLIDNNMMAFTPNESLNYAFTFFLLKNTRLSKYAQVGALPSYNSSDLKIIKINIPKSKDEQLKIANLLTSLEEKIDLVSQQLSQIETFKKGLLQKIFV